MTRRKTHQIRLFGVTVAGLLVVMLIGLQTFVGAITRGYTTKDAGLQTGMVVSLNLSGDFDSVERATQTTDGLVVGVVTTLDASLVTIISGKTDLLVETEGQVDAYVSDFNGSINEGDRLVVSQFKGILMKSGEASANVVAVAIDKAAQTTSYSYQDNGQTKQIQIAKIKVNLIRKSVVSTNVSNSTLSRLGRSLTGKDVTEARLILALVILLVVLIAVSGILYGAISGALTALGRNSLPKKSIKHELVRDILMAFVILATGLGAMYAMLWV